MPYPPQYGVTPAIIGELIAINPRGSGALDLRMRICKESMCSAQIDCLVNVRTYAHLEDSHRTFGIHYEHYHWHRGQENDVWIC